MELDSFPDGFEFTESSLKCEKCGKIYALPRTVSKQQKYVLRETNSSAFKAKKYINIDDEAVPIAENKISTKDNRYFVVSKIMESKVGLRLVIYAGEKGKKGKKERTQIFVEPDIRRLSFDQNDLHPIKVFTKIEATFSDGTKQAIEKGK